MKLKNKSMGLSFQSTDTVGVSIFEVLSFTQKVILAFCVIVAMFWASLHINCFALTFGDMANSIAGQTSGMADAVKKLSVVVGLCLIAAGVVSFATMKKTQTPMGIPIAMLLAGIFLVSLPMLISTGSNTFFGSTNSSSSTGALLQ